MALKGKKVLIGLTGGVACYKIPYLVRFLVKEGASVRVIMTEAATKFITPLTLETVSENPVATELFPEERFVGTRHIDMAEWPDLFVIAPATANFLGKVASGISDDLLTTIVCATAQPVMIAPAMNPRMWLNPITQKNYRFLKDTGYLFIDPAEGEMACHHWGVGRVAEPEDILERIKAFFATKKPTRKLAKKKILVTAGPTREALDPVRFITNRSSGKMGYALAEAASAMGAETTLISGPVDRPVPKNVRLISVESTDDLYRAVKQEFKKTDCLIMAAAPSDFAPETVAVNKIKKDRQSLQLKMKPTVDILRAVGKTKSPQQVIVGFALETEDAVNNARRKLKAKHLDMIVLNQPGEGTGFDTDTNIVTILMPGKKSVTWPMMTKRELSAKLLDKLASML